MPRQTPSTGVPPADALAQQLVEPELVKVAPSLGGKAPTPGSTSPSAARSPAGRWVTWRATPTCSSAFSTERRLPMP